MNINIQHTISSPCEFEGKGLHTGGYAHLRILPAPAGSGIRFVRTDLGAEVPALAEFVSRTDRSTTLSSGGASVSTVEHILSALSGMGVDNALIEIDGPEVPILDGSALPFAEGLKAMGIKELDAPRRFVEVLEPVIVESGLSRIELAPCDHLEINLTIDFSSQVLAAQTVRWLEGDDYFEGVAPCRTFVFYHDIEPLLRAGLVKGGDVHNAIIMMEHPVPQEDLDSLCDLLGMSHRCAAQAHYLNESPLRFPDECARHKLLDLLGDLTLCGGALRARVTATRPGHSINTAAAKAVRKSLKANE